MRRVFLSVVLFCVIALPLSCVPRNYSRTEFALGTVVQVTFFANRVDSDEVFKKLFSVADKYERMFSSKRSFGEIYKINSSGGSVKLDGEIYELLRHSDYYYKLTKGAFDYTLYNLISLWDLEHLKASPLSGAIDEALVHSGRDKVKFDKSFIRLTDGVKLDFGAIAKGFILQKLSDTLKDLGIHDFMVNAGGDVILSGLYQRKREWNIAIKDPFGEKEFAGYITLTDATIVTSGDYERYFVDETTGKRYHHILSGESGYPAESGVSSVTVISSDPVRADAMATALFVMGADSGLKLVNGITDVDAIFIKQDGSIATSARISQESRGGRLFFIRK